MIYFKIYVNSDIFMLFGSFIKVYKLSSSELKYSSKLFSIPVNLVTFSIMFIYVSFAFKFALLVFQAIFFCNHTFLQHMSLQDIIALMLAGLISVCG